MDCSQEPGGFCSQCFGAVDNRLGESLCLTQVVDPKARRACSKTPVLHSSGAILLDCWGITTLIDSAVIRIKVSIACSLNTSAELHSKKASDQSLDILTVPEFVPNPGDPVGAYQHRLRDRARFVSELERVVSWKQRCDKRSLAAQDNRFIASRTFTCAKGDASTATGTGTG